jgi:hypothetical protein
MTNLFNPSDKYLFETDIEPDEVVNIFKTEGIKIDEQLYYSPIKPTYFISKPYYGTFSHPNKFLIKSRFAFNPKTETEIEVLRKDKTIVEFTENNMPMKLLLILMALPFIGLFFYFNLSDQFDFNFLVSLVVLVFPVMILGTGTLIITYSSKSKKSYFEELLKRKTWHNNGEHS